MVSLTLALLSRVLARAGSMSVFDVGVSFRFIFRLCFQDGWFFGFSFVLVHCM
jgi:hypothetical protein